MNSLPNPMTTLWVYIKGQDSIFSTSIPPQYSIHALRKQIYDEQVKFIIKCGSTQLTLTKVDVIYNEETQERVRARVFQPTPNDRRLCEMDSISDVWKQPSDGYIHVFVSLPSESFSSVSLGHLLFPSVTGLNMARYDAANNLHNVMWKNTLEERLQDVGNCEGYKYLPQVDDLRPRALGCDADVILWRNEYLFTLEKLKEFRAKFGVGGVLVTGQPGIGKSVFLFYLLLHLLSIGEPVALQLDEVFFLFTEDGVEMFDGDRTEWKFNCNGKLWALSDSNQHTVRPCRSFRMFSKERQAFIVQITSSAEDQWKAWSKECYMALFVMKCFTEKEAEALSVIMNLKVDSFVRDFKKWGPNVHTCIGLALGVLTEEWLI